MPSEQAGGKQQHDSSFDDWGPAQEKEVEWIKLQLSKPPVLAFPDWSKQFIVRTDASGQGLGCTLSQEHDGVRRPIAFFSRKIVGAELNYDARNLECLAVHWGTTKCREYTQGSHFILETDHRNLQYLSQATPEHRRIFNYAQALSALNFTLKHVPGLSLCDADCLSRSPLPDDVPADEVDAFDFPDDMLDHAGVPTHPAGGNVQATAAVAADVKNKLQPKTPNAKGAYNVLLMGYGACTDSMAMAGLNFNVVGGCEIDPLAKKEFARRHPTAKDYGSIDELLLAMEQGLSLPPIHVMSGTMPCRGRSRLARLNRNKTPPPDDHLFYRQLDVVEAIQPTLFYAEMVPPSRHDNEGTAMSKNDTLNDDMARAASYSEFERELTHRLGYNVCSEVVNMAEHGAFTDRRRYICCAYATDTNNDMSIPTENATFPGLAQILDDPATVHPSLRADAFTRVLSQNHKDTFDAKKIGTVSINGAGAQPCDNLHNRVHDIAHPLPTITTHFSWAGSNGGQWICDEIGARRLTINEMARAHNFDDKGLAFLSNMSQKQAQGFVGRSLPAAFLAKLYRNMQTFLQKATANEAAPLKRVQFVQPTFVNIEFPEVAELRTAQRADKDIAPLIAYLEAGKDETELPIAGRYARLAKYMHMHKELVFYREEIGSGEVLTDAVLVPQTLQQQVIASVHESAYYGHPGEKATLKLLRDQAFWKNMSRDVKKYVRDCAACAKAKITMHQHAGLTKNQLHRRHHARADVDLIGPFVSVDGLTHVLHITEAATGFNTIATIAGKDAATVAAAFHEHYILQHGAPEAILSDNGTEFVNKLLAALLDQHAESRPRVYHDRERVNQNDHLGRVLFNGVVRDTYDCG